MDRSNTSGSQRSTRGNKEDRMNANSGLADGTVRKTIGV